MNIRTRACLSSSGSTRDTRRCTRDLDRRGLPPPILPPVLEPNQHTLKRPALSDESSVHLTRTQTHMPTSVANAALASLLG